MSSNKKGVLVVGVAGLASLAFMAGIVFLADGANQAPRQAEITLPAFELRNDYRRDPSAADANYKEKVLKIVAPVQSVEPGLGYVSLGGVDCYFDPAHRQELASLRVGNSVTLVGVCKGMKGGVVIIQGCRTVH